MSVLEVTARIREIRTSLGLSNAPVVKGDFAQALQSATASAPDVIASAEKYLGVPYVFGSTNPKVGLDCSSFVQRAYADIGVALPRLAKDQAKVGVEVPSLAQARPGDLVAFDEPVDHIGIYVGDGKMIVAPHTGDVVKIQKVYETPSTIRRVTPEPPAVTPAPIVRPAALSTSDIPFADLFKAAGAKYGLSPGLLAAVAKVESNYRADAVSKAGAQGLMQLMPATAAGMGVDAFNPAQAVDAAARILAKNLKDFGSLPLALAAYNAGGGAVRRYGGVPPFAETQAYVPKVQAAMAALAERGFA
jgi:hypothetical protein